MSRITCKECKQLIARDATECPSCGRPFVPRSLIARAEAAHRGGDYRKVTGALALLVVAASIVIGSLTRAGESSAPTSSAARSAIDYKLALLDGQPGEAMRYTPLLDTLDARCAESRDQIADMATRAGRTIKETTGRPTSMERILREWERATTTLTPPNANCASALAATIAQMPSP